MSNNTVLFNIDRILSGAISQSSSVPESDGNRGMLHFPKTPALQEPFHQIVLCDMQDTC